MRKIVWNVVEERLIGETRYFNFEERIFHVVILIGILLTTVGTMLDIYYGARVLGDFIFLGSWGITYYFSRWKKCFGLASKISIFVAVIGFYPFLWINAGGIKGLAPYYGILMVAMMCIILFGRFRILMLLSLLVIEILLDITNGLKNGPMEFFNNKGFNLYDQSLHLWITMLAMAVLILVYSNTYMKEKAQRESYGNMVKENYNQQLYYMENLEQVVFQLKSKGHDFRNHLGVIYGLLESDEREEARAYVSRLVNESKDYQNTVNLPYPMMRAMINYKLMIAKEKGIEIKINTSVPEGLSLNEFDITVILGNLLDNGIEACEKQGGKSSYISLNVLFKPDYLVIQVENPSTQKVDLEKEISQTTKRDKENHGFGLKNIKYLVNKYQGFMEFNQENGMFKVNIALLTSETITDI